MEATRNYYEAPATEVVELKTEGLICLSDPNNQFGLPGFGDANEI
jgi:hypothetical protein